MKPIKAENDWVEMEIRGHYFFVKYKKNKNLDINAAKRIIEDSVVLAGDMIYPVLTDITNMPPHEKEVRDYFAKDASKSALANAILVSSPLSSIIANFFLSLSKPEIPTKMFTDQAKAAKWLTLFPAKTRAVLV